MLGPVVNMDFSIFLRARKEFENLVGFLRAVPVGRGASGRRGSEVMGVMGLGYRGLFWVLGFFGEGVPLFSGPWRCGRRFCGGVGGGSVGRIGGLRRARIGAIAKRRNRGPGVWVLFGRGERFLRLVWPKRPGQGESDRSRERRLERH